ncbi:hypothetical protein ACQ4PT_010294 [Festuca glaucescens]
MADVSAFPPSPPTPSPLATDALLAPWPLSPWPAPLRHGDGSRPNPLFAILPLSALAIGLVLLVAVAVILVLTRRGRLRLAGAVVSVDGDKPGGAPASSCGSSVRASHNARCYPAAGCIYGGRLGPMGLAAAQPRSRGAQVFTYRELERATDGFGEGNVLGRGAYGVVYRGRLGDGTPAAIKRLQLDLRRQGEREFRVEALPRLTNRERLVQMVDPALKGQFAVKDLIQVGAIAAMCVQTKAEYRPLMTDVVQSLIPIVKKSPVMSCSSTPARPLQHVVYMSPLQKQASVAGKAS